MDKNAETFSSLMQDSALPWEENLDKDANSENIIDIHTLGKPITRSSTNLTSRGGSLRPGENPENANENNNSNEEKTETKSEKNQPDLHTTASEASKSEASMSNTSTFDTILNSYILDVIKTYAPGRYPYLLNEDYINYNGVTENLNYQGRLLLKANPAGNRASHCSGITFEVFFKAMQNRNKKLGIDPDNFNGMSFDQLYDFVLNWYVANGNKNISNVSIAVEKYGIGKGIKNFEDAKAGDIIDFSRENNTGHTVVFLNWLRDKSGRIIGLKYWSSQESTNGISYKEEYFNVTDSNGKKYGNVIFNMVYIARISAVKDYKQY